MIIKGNPRALVFNLLLRNGDVLVSNNMKAGRRSVPSVAVPQFYVETR